MPTKKSREDHAGRHRRVFEQHKKIIFATQTHCGICGQPVDFSLKFPHPLSPTADHIIPVAKGGDPSALENLQLAHLACNRAKSDKILTEQAQKAKRKPVTNRDLPLSRDWTTY